MKQESAKKTTVWKLRVPLTLVEKIRKLADKDQRSMTKQAAVLLEEAITARQ